MKRNIKLEGIILKNYRVGDYHKGAVIFTPTQGIIYAVAYGGYRPKSRLGPLVQPLTAGIFQIYSDPVKKSIKIMEYDPSHYYKSIKSNLEKYYSAILWFEIILKSHGGGESGTYLYDLLQTSLFHLEKHQAGSSGRIMIQFLLRSIVCLGGSIQIHNCGICGNRLQPGTDAYYSIRESCFVCSSCCTADMFVIVPGLRKYTEYTLSSGFENALNAGIDNNMLKYFKSLLYSIIQEYLESSLSVLQTGREFLI